ncbi:MULTISPECIES: PcfK-like family protein [unclassified Pedobacter]|uniref:PcfK-like family protein n=1 Tax=unclassified Pedobacter TaxID=2628915 RepID=UPI001421D168|nr:MULTISPECIES: PcfK-like family protein [unclassified Pedobacter]NII81696.1 hypothetical protein [Pedobacter sp. SG908]NMN35700.1 hypothetical protein [Pedobacter sp. SG918]
MSKGTEAFKKIINDHLQHRAVNDPLFAATLAKENKSLDECINYIFSEVKKSGCAGFADEEVFNMAVHYFDEDSIKDVKSINGNVVVNHSMPSNSKVDKSAIPMANPSLPIKKAKPVISNQSSLF